MIVDATIVDSPHHPHLPKNLVIVGDREDTRSELQKLDEVAYHAELKYTEPSIDHEARWVSRGNVSRFGFKHHVVTDPNGIVLSVLTTSANVTDTTMFKQLLDTVDLPLATPVLVDKGYECKSNRDYVHAHHYTDGLMYKKSKGEDPSPTKARCNRRISAGRYAIERTFGSVHIWFGGGCARYRGIAKTHTQGILEFMAYNIKRMLRLELREHDAMW